MKKRYIIFGAIGLILVGACLINLPTIKSYAAKIGSIPSSKGQVESTAGQLKQAKIEGRSATSQYSLLEGHAVEPPPVWPEIDPRTGKVSSAETQIRVMKPKSKGSYYMIPAEYTTKRVDPRQYRGVVHFVYENGARAADDVVVYFYPGQYAEIKVPYHPGLYSDRPEIWSWEGFNETIVYSVERPPACIWDNPFYSNLRTTVPGQY